MTYRRLKDVLLLISMAFVLVGCGCGGNDEAVAMVQGLSKNRLEQLYRNVDALDASRKKGHWLQFSKDKKNIPREFADLHPQYIAIDGDSSRIHLSGCGDDKVYLFFTGIDSSIKRSIRLSPGEAQDHQVVWQSQ